MNEALIGEEVSLDGPADAGFVALLVGAVEAFLLAAGGEPKDLQTLETDLRAALSALDPGSNERVFARLVVATGGIEVHLQPEAGSEVDRTVICPV